MPRAAELKQPRREQRKKEVESKREREKRIFFFFWFLYFSTAGREGLQFFFFRKSAPKFWGVILKKKLRGLNVKYLNILNFSKLPGARWVRSLLIIIRLLRFDSPRCHGRMGGGVVSLPKNKRDISGLLVWEQRRI